MTSSKTGVMLTSAPETLVKDTKKSNFYISNYILYTLKK
jgi:hypothetical protein